MTCTRAFKYVLPPTNQIICSHIYLMGLEQGHKVKYINLLWKSAMNLDTGWFTSHRVSLASWQGPPVPDDLMSPHFAAGPILVIVQYVQSSEKRYWIFFFSTWIL